MAQFGMGIADASEGFMDAPQLRGGGGGDDGPSFIASVLDLVGIHTQVANRKPKDGAPPAKAKVNSKGLVEPEFRYRPEPTQRPSLRAHDPDWTPIDPLQLGHNRLLDSITNSILGGNFGAKPPGLG